MAGINAYTVLCLHCNGEDGSTTFTDSSDSAHAITVVNNAQIDTAQYKWTSSGLFNSATSDYIYALPSSDWNFGSAPWTIDCWLRTPEDQHNKCPVCIGGQQIGFWQMSSYKIGFDVSDDLGTRYYDFSTGSIAQNSWTHLALVRNGTNLYFFVNGIKKVTKDVGTNTFNKSADALYVGGPGSYYFNGWVEELRIQKGEACWTSDFTPETEEYSSVTTEADFTDDFVTDDNMSAQNYTGYVADDFTVDDAILGTSPVEEVFVEELTLDEAITATSPVVGEIAEDVTLDDTNWAQNYTGYVTDNLSLDDEIKGLGDVKLDFTDNLSLDDSVLGGKYFEESISDDLTLQDTNSVELEVLITDSITLHDISTGELVCASANLDEDFPVFFELEARTGFNCRLESDTMFPEAEGYTGAVLSDKMSKFDVSGTMSTVKTGTLNWTTPRILCDATAFCSISCNLDKSISYPSLSATSFNSVFCALSVNTAFPTITSTGSFVSVGDLDCEIMFPSLFAELKISGRFEDYILRYNRP